jgi:hypothetical protein
MEVFMKSKNLLSAEGLMAMEFFLFRKIISFEQNRTFFGYYQKKLKP